MPTVKGATVKKRAVKKPEKAKAAKPEGKVTKKTTPKKTPAKKVARTMGKESAGVRRANLVRQLKKLGATSQSSSRIVEDLAERLGLTKFDVYGLICGTSGKTGSAPNCLVATGHVKVVKGVDPERPKQVGVYLTAKGKATKFSEPPFVRAAKK